MPVRRRHWLAKAAPAGLLVAALFVAESASGEQVVLAASRDNSIYQENTTNSNGGGYLFIGRAGGGGIRRSLLSFDLGSIIPANSHIDSVSLQLFVSRASIDGTLPATLHLLLGDWGEAGSNAGERAGAGAPAQTGDATWLAQFYPGDMWTTPGGDFVAQASAAALLGGDAASYTIGSTPGMVADAQLWLDTPSSNFGWLIRGDESENGTARRIDSREFPDAALRPLLTVSYTPAPVPLPATLPLLLGALGGFGFLTRRAAQSPGASGIRIRRTVVSDRSG